MGVGEARPDRTVGVQVDTTPLPPNATLNGSGMVTPTTLSTATQGLEGGQEIAPLATRARLGIHAERWPGTGSARGDDPDRGLLSPISQ